MKPFYKTDWFLKIVSLVVAIIMWAYISYGKDSQYETWIRGIDVVQTNLSQDFENGKLVIMEGATDKIDIKIRGDRKDVAAVKAGNIKAVIDMININREGTFEQQAINVTIPVDGIEIVQKTPAYAKVVVDKIVTVEKRINAEVKGVPSEGYVVGDYKLAPESVKLTGPESIINTVSNVKAVIDLAEAEANPESLFKIKLYDVNDNEIVNSLITQNIEYVQASDLFAETKMVDVIVDTNSTVNEKGEKVEYTVLSSAKIQLSGDEEILKNISSISTEKVDVSKISLDTEITTKLIVPEGIKLVNDKDIDVKIKFIVNK